VLVGPAHDAPLHCQPTRGPVVAVRRVPSFDETLAVAGGCAGAVTVLTPSPAHAQRAWRELPVATVRMNTTGDAAPGPELLDAMTRGRLVRLAPCPERGQGTIRGR
jgi:betaine-aldehyde dehydrogenase